jgi:tetratricopeptide (TPR) repeat protein
LFPRGVSELPSLAEDSDKRYALVALGQSYQFSGQPSRAVLLYRRCDEIDARLKDDGNRQATLLNLGYALRETGALREAGSVLRSALILIHRLGGIHRQAALLLELGRVLTTQDHRLGGVALHRARSIFMERGHHQYSGVASAYLAERSISMGDPFKARSLADKAWELASDRKFERDFIRAALVRGRVALGLSNLTRADEDLHHALTRTRAVNVVEHEVSALIAIAELKLVRGRRAEARTALDDVWEAAERGRYPLYQADAYNVLAHIELAEGNKPAATAAATNAYRAA